MLSRFKYSLKNVNNSVKIINSFKNYSSFSSRHIDLNKSDINSMLITCNSDENLDLLIDECIPNINNHNLKYFDPILEHDCLKNIKIMFDKNIDCKTYIGMGFTKSHLPYVIQRNILENPQWYTAYTPYQSEISQGRLESLYNYQTIVKELTGHQISNASLLDEASSASEIINICNNYYRNKRNKFYCSKNIHPYTLNVLKTKCYAANIELIICDLNNINLDKKNTLGIMFQYPNTFGEIDIPENIINECKDNDIIVSCSTNLLSLLNLKSPNELGVDLAFGSVQNFGIPMWFGGPHPAFISGKQKFIRYLPGRIIGKTIDNFGDEGYRISLQTREQHIKKDKATSNICTSQALLANVAAMYAIYHGYEGLLNINKSIHNKCIYLHNNLENNGINVLNESYFDTLYLDDNNYKIYNKLIKNNILTRKFGNNKIGITLDETTKYDDIDQILSSIDIKSENFEKSNNYDYNCINRSDLKSSKFYKQISETNMLRYIHNLANKDYTLCDGMIPLGSCTMKLNATSQLQPLSWEKVMNVHPYAPDEYTKGYREMIDKLSTKLKDITGFNNISYQSNSGAMGEYSGLLCIKKYHEVLGEKERNICLIPESAHGTNFSSAKLAGLKIVKFNDKMSLDEISKVIDKYRENLSCLMITYPGTDGIFQDNIKDICSLIHENGGLVYMDGANMNALVGLTSPASCGADVCHLNLHKTFCIPHGGGGPGMGPILCNSKLAEFLPNNEIQTNINNINSIGNITNSQWSSASILVISLIYIELMGSDDLKYATKMAILNSNYLKDSLKHDFNISEVNKYSRVGHEFIIDFSKFNDIDISEVDISKRLIDYNFHPGTMSWPKKGVIMFEPTESESKHELDRLILAMKNIKRELDEIYDKKYDTTNNVFKNAPHSLNLLNRKWNYPYSTQKAYYPLSSLLQDKKFPSINRVNDVYGDKNILKNV